MTLTSSGYLVRCDDDKLYVLQVGGKSARPNNTTNETIGSYLMNRLGFCVPRCRVALINDKSISIAKECDVVLSQKSTKGSIVTHFASEFLHEADHQLFSKKSPVPAAQIYNYEQMLGMFVFDVFAGKVDRRACVYKQDMRSGRVSAFFVGNGNLFGGPAWADLGSRPAVLYVSGCRRPVIGDQDLAEWTAYIQENIPMILHDVENFASYQMLGPDLAVLKKCLLKRGEQLEELVRKEVALQGQLEYPGGESLVRPFARLRAGAEAKLCSSEPD